MSGEFTGKVAQARHDRSGPLPRRRLRPGRGPRHRALPGLVRTPMADLVMDTVGEPAGPDRAGAYRLAASLTPLRRVAEPDEIAFLAGPRSAVITGAVLMAGLGASTADLSLGALNTPELTEDECD